MKEIYNAVSKLGLREKEIYRIVKNSNANKYDTSFSLGPLRYPGTHYGTISINDFY